MYNNLCEKLLRVIFDILLNLQIEEFIKVVQNIKSSKITLKKKNKIYLCI